ncbi:MAG: hypothetical protein A2W26_00525 [Acidobacteria bacterium RBG_16_64_8]|nr:MAG: hypothetical protein A2W26_00525 [Acidobacteria bacterium RBG_16_64_8]
MTFLMNVLASALGMAPVVACLVVWLVRRERRLVNRVDDLELKLTTIAAAKRRVRTWPLS